MILTRVALRELAPEERQALEHLASSRTAQARFVERAQLLLAIAAGRRPSQVAKDLGISRPTVYTWIHRFNEQGLHGLEDQPRAGRPPTYTAEQRAEVIATALTDPKSLDLPFACWTLDRLQAYLNEQKGIPIKRSRIDEILLGEGLRWRHQETWFGERVVEGAAEPGAEGEAIRELGGWLPGGGRGDGLLEQAPSPLHLGTSSAPSASPPARHRGCARCQATCRMNHLEQVKCRKTNPRKGMFQFS